MGKMRDSGAFQVERFGRFETGKRLNNKETYAKIKMVF